MELQSRWIARILAGELPMPDRATMEAGVAAEREMRTRVPRPQFPHGDFVALADGLAREVGVWPALADDDPLRARIMEGPLVPAHYRLMGPHAKPELARALIAETPAPVLDDPPEPPRQLMLGRDVLATLRGRWAIQRQIEPGGHFSGVAAFTQRSADSLLYRESGELTSGRRHHVNGGKQLCLRAAQRRHRGQLCGGPEPRHAFHRYCSAG